MPRISQNNRVFHSGKRLGLASREYVRLLHNQGLHHKKIMGRTKLSLKTIKKYLVHNEPPREEGNPITILVEITCYEISFALFSALF